MPQASLTQDRQRGNSPSLSPIIRALVTHAAAVACARLIGRGSRWRRCSVRCRGWCLVALPVTAAPAPWGCLWPLWLRREHSQERFQQRQWRRIGLQGGQLFALWESSRSHLTKHVGDFSHRLAVLIHDIQEIRECPRREILSRGIWSEISVRFRSMVTNKVANHVCTFTQRLLCVTTLGLQALKLCGFCRKPSVKFAMKSGKDVLQRTLI